MPRNPLEAGYRFTRLRLCKNRILDRGVVDAQQLDGTDIAPGPRYQSRSRRPTAQRSAEDVVIGPTDKASTSAVRVKHNQSFPFGLCTRQEPRNIPLSTALMQDSVSTSTPTNWHGLKRPFRRAGLHSRSITKTGEISRNVMFGDALGRHTPHASLQCERDIGSHREIECQPGPRSREAGCCRPESPPAAVITSIAK